MYSRAVHLPWKSFWERRNLCSAEVPEDACLTDAG
jgi:hypothetical protein